jgi:ketol-acid reductoisomerase
LKDLFDNTERFSLGNINGVDCIAEQGKPEKVATFSSQSQAKIMCQKLNDGGFDPARMHWVNPAKIGGVK